MLSPGSLKNVSRRTVWLSRLRRFFARIENHRPSRSFRISLSLLTLAGILIPFATVFSSDPTFQARVTLALCPEYQLGGVTVGVNYTIGASPQVYSPTILSQTIDQAQNLGVFELALPSYLGRLPINIYAQCTNSFGASPKSNTVAISNCDALALKDSDSDGILNRDEDTNCDNFFSPGDFSNPDNVDSDGDGIRDLVEYFAQTTPTNPASSPRPFIYKGAPFDPDGDGNSNALVWRPSTGMWYVRDFINPGNHLQFQWGMRGDVPFVYDAAGFPTNVGVGRQLSNNQLSWLFRGSGFKRSSGAYETTITFGLFGDNIIPGPWEKPGVTNPAVARLFNNTWTFYIYLSDGNYRIINWGGNGDLLKVADYDGDGLLDYGLLRLTENRIYVRLQNGTTITRDLGSGTEEYLVAGDYTGDGIADMVLWEPNGGFFDMLASDDSFDESSMSTLQLGLYNVHIPMSYNRQNDKDLFTVIDHTSGMRYWREDNNPSNAPQSVQWGLSGDSQG